MKHFGIIVLIVLVVCTTPVFAQTATRSATPTKDVTQTPAETQKLKQIEDLKERLATKVAQLRQIQRKALYGKIQSTSVTTINIETQNKVVKIELTDDIKIFQVIKGKRTKLTQEALAKDDYVTVFGEYDATLDLLKAKIVFIQSEPPIHKIGKISDLNKKAFSFTLQTDQQKPYTVDFESTTKGLVWNGDKTEKAGFSKFAIGDSVLVTGSFVPKKDNQISAERIILLAQNLSISSTPVQAQATPSATQKP